MAVETTRIVGSVILPGVQVASAARLTISLTQPGTAPDGALQRVVSTEPVVVRADASGAFDFALIPNDVITPAGTRWRVDVALLAGGCWTWYWDLASSPDPIDIGDIPRVAL